MNKVEIKSDTTMTGTWMDFPANTLVVIGGGRTVPSSYRGLVCIIPFRFGKAGEAALISLNDGTTWDTQNCLPLRKLPVGTKVEITVCDDA